MSGTRTALLEDISNWITSFDSAKPAEIFWLADQPGTGKSAIAHTVARDSHLNGVLGSSFFFDRAVSHRNNAQRLISTIIRDLCGRNDKFANAVGAELDQERGLASSSPRRQFVDLLLKYSRATFDMDKPVLLVIDSLDECTGYDPELLDILCNELPKLPGMFRVLLTSRPEWAIATQLKHHAHVKAHNLDISGDANRVDVMKYIEERMRSIASFAALSPEWPGKEITNTLALKSEGLFIWASVVCSYLRNASFRDKKLQVLISNETSSPLSIDEKMDRLYSTVLDSCD